MLIDAFDQFLVGIMESLKSGDMIEVFRVDALEGPVEKQMLERRFQAGKAIVLVYTVHAGNDFGRYVWWHKKV